ncbi:hypothetical protein ACI6Q2_13990 [Chitinophagaceae bacterium LWZ2-11]
MKKLLIPALAGMGLCFAQTIVNAQDETKARVEFKEHVSKQFDFKNGVVAVYNVEGFIKVEGYAGDKVTMEVDKTIYADNQESLDQGKQEFKLMFDQNTDSIISYILEPYDSRPHRTVYDDNGEHRRRYYRVRLDYTIKVPFNSNLCVSTVNRGNVDVKDVYGALKVNNVNGGITIVNAKGTTNARTINGPLTINYLSIPPDASSYFSLNGTLKVTYPSSLSADLEFKSMNGKFYTDFENTEVLPSKVVKLESKKDEGSTVYKLSKSSQIRIGSGGKDFKFETLNGNIYIQKQQ